MSRSSNAIVLAATIVPLAGLVVLIATYAVNVPFWDDWRWAAMIVTADAGRLTFADLWHPNNEHRILIPSLIALGLARLGGYDTVRECFFSVACVAATLGFVLVLLRRTVPSALVAPLFAVSALLLFSLGQVQSWLWGFQLAWFFIDLCLFAQIVALSGERLGWGQWTTALVATLLASFSSAFGLGTLAVGFFLLFVRRPRLRGALVLWLAFSLAIVLVYLWGMHFDQPQYRPLHDATLWQRLQFLLVFEGAPIGGWIGNEWSLAFGVLALGLGAALALRFVRLVLDEPRAAAAWAPWLGVLLFGFLGGVLTAAGRSGWGLDFARSARYITLATLTWVALVPLATLALARVVPQTKRIWRALALSGAVIVAASFGLMNVTGFELFHAGNEVLLHDLFLVRDYRNVNNATLVAALFAEPRALAVWRASRDPDPDRIRELIAQLAAAHEGPFR
ncbi:MAG TPA: hypothetical protein VKG44_08280 [Candidatus Baltobacteraceae bacterium]|nr:hypothetical protein [Candidatus Baltobacteraceae bacterium]